MAEKIEKTSEIFEKNASDKLSFLILVDELISSLPVRSQEILKERFGLSSKKGKTLEKIGKKYSITRERVRQIITDAIKNISKKAGEENFSRAENRIVFAIRENNGIIKEEDIFLNLGSGSSQEKNALAFFVQCSKKILIVFEKGTLEKSWVLSKDVIASVKKVHEKAKDVFGKEQKPLGDEEVLEKLSEDFSGAEKEQILNFLSISTEFGKNVFGKWGIKNWDEINPKGTREKLHLILKETGKPLHFTEIASLIDKHKLGKKKAHPQTVHNELIKDSRFVLIGRGIYALSEWGYEEGTIKDVLKDILEKSKKPLRKDEILEKVMEVRKVKKTTVMINLNNSEFFEKKEDLYYIKK
ncbi:MAG TPA: HTH domain-containing protein [Candidatus Moranbacteria bacterium]|nr:HTH domain-containing protein [Candidatus Moranbacteria bacterium]